MISEKHGGLTSADNLAYACVYCNRSKGTDLGSIAQTSGQYIRFFNPRVDRWYEHFSIKSASIEPVTEIGEVTAQILALNSVERLLEREALVMIGRFPPREAAARLKPSSTQRP
ncbi:MAG: HNH endonuclease [Candidatus Saccharimonadales bacterium]